MAANAEGASPPVFDQIFRNARFAQGGNALFEGRVKGNPKPQVIWTRKGLQMKGTEKHQMLYDENSGKVSLLIKSIGPGDEGEYTCTALNPYGEAICTVYISPEATKQVKKSRSGHKLHKSSSNKQVQMVQQQQQTQQQQKQQFGVQQQNVMQHQQHQTSGYQQQQQQSFQQSSASSFQQSASFSQESSSSTQQFSSSQEMSTVKQTSSSSFNQFGVQQQQIVSNDEDDQTLIPKFVSCSGNIEAFEGDQVRVNARVTGRPAPDIKWYLNSETPLVQDDSHKLLINETGCHTLLFTSIKMSEAGIIKCIATNRSGQATFQCNLAVKSKTETCSPHFGEKLQNCKVELGENLTLSVKAVGRPIPKLSWLKDGSALVSSDNVRVNFEEDGRSTIHISNADKRNDGWYQVSAFNSKGSAITRARIQVNYQKDASVKDFSYSREETYRINRPIGKLLEPEQESEPEVIYLKHVERAQQHQKPHETESKFGPPSFVTPMRDAVIFEGEKCHFDAKVMPVGDPSMRVEWLFNGKPIPASSRMNSSCQFGFVSLDMLNSATSDSGEYTCVVTNEAGRVHCSCRLLVNVKKEVETEFRHATKQMEQTITETRLKEIKEPPPPQPEFVKPLVGIGEKPEGSNVHLEAQINPVSDHTMKIEWFKDGKAITASSRIGTIFNFGYVSLNINGLRVEDAGTYTCRATNVSGEAVTSTTLHVKITQDLISSTGISEQQQYIEKVQQLEQYQATKNLKRTESVIEPTSAPEFKTKLKNQTDIREGGFAHFEARLEPMGDETMKVEWRKDGQLVEASSRITSFFNFGYVALTIKQVASHDAGHYTCTAYNTKGRAETSATLSTSVNVDSEFQSKSWSSIQKLESTKSSTSATLAQPEVTTPPTFVSQLKGTNVILEGQRAHFECRIEPQNDPNLSVHWLHNGSQLQASSRIQTYNDFGYVAFDILDVKKEDAGVYTLIVNNLLGQQQTNVELKVMNHNDSVDYSTIHSRAVEETKKFEAKQQHSTVVQGTEKVCTSAPVFRTPLQNPRPVTEGQNIHLEARLEPIGDPTMKVEWLFNDRSLTVGSRFKTYNDFGFIALDIIGVNAQDSGMYTCRATNQLGTAQTTAKVEVHVKSSVITETENEASLQQINYLESSEKYQQMMVEDNEPKQPPSFVKNLHNVEIVEGKNVHLEARVHPIGDSTMKIEWTVNGKPLKAGHKIRPAYDFDYVALDLLSVYPEDSGLYTCTARNAFGEAQSSATVKVTPTTEVTMDSKTAQNLQRLNLLEQRSVARLSHKHGDLDEDLDQFLESPHFVTQPKDIPHMVEGKNAHFEAKLEPLTDPNLTVEWFKNGKPITVGHRFRPIHDFGYVALDIVGVISEDSGTYTCKATNLAGSCLCQAVLNCQSGKQIVSESNSEMSQFQMLEHKKMSGRHEIDEEITTQAPVFTTSMKSVEIKEGQRAHFECRIIPVSDPTLKVQWLHNNKPIKQATRIKEGLDFGFVSLDIMHAYPDDAGTYTCRAVNKLGEAINSVELIVKAKETIIKDTMHQAAMSQIQHLEQAHVAQTQDEGLTTQIPNFTSGMKDLVLLEGTSAHFEAKLVPIGDPKLRVEWLHDGKPIQASNRMSTLHDFGFVALDLKYTRPEDSGTYTCRAVNALGEATVSATMQIVSAQNGPMGETMHEDALQKIANLEQKRYVSHVMEDEVVQSAPVFVVPLQGKTELVEGQNIHMECRIEPYPDSSLRVEWLHNGKPLPFGNRWRTSYDFGFAALDIIGCYPEDSGIYTLRATNSLGMTESHIEFKVSSRSGLLLDSEHIDALEKIKYLESRRRRENEEESIVTEGPQFGHVLRDLKLDEGQPAHFETTLTPVNDANMKVEWLYNGKPIPQGHRFRTTYDFGFVALDILYAYPEDSGSYTCVAKNAIGEQSTSCNLTVKGKASLLLDTMDRERLTHLRNLENKPDYRTEQGEIKLVKPVFTTPLNNSEGIPEQSHVHLECRLEPVNDPNLKVEWFVEGKAIQTGHRFRTTHDFGYVALDILYAYSEDSGTYICKATNKLGEAVNTCSVSIVGKKSLLLDSQHAESWQKIQHLESRNQQSRLQVVDLPVGPPRFITELMGKTTLSEGQNAHFEAQVEPINDPNLKIEFTHNGKPLMQASRIHTLCDFGYVALDIAQLIVDDKGEYICRIYNSHGEVSSKINLNISGRDTLDMSSQRPEGLEKIRELESRKQRERHEELVTFQKPVFTQALLNVEKEENQSAHLEARLIPIGDPSLKVEWFKDGNLISSGSRINTLHDFGFVSLDITGLRASDEGVYECRAINSLGEATTTATIKVATKGSLILDSQHPEGMRKITALESSKLKHQISENESEFEKPTFVSTLTGTSEVQEGQRAHMECRVVPLGDPNLKFSWFKNGESLTTGSRIQATQDFGFVTLDIASCIPEDSGMYTVKAYNLVGEASTSFALRVGDKSGIMKDALQPDSLKRIQELEAHRNQKKKRTEDTLISQPPVFMQPLQDVGAIAEGQNIHVEASIEPRNDPDLKVDWEFNGKPLQSGSRIKTTLDFGHVQLFINGVRGDDSGLYTCKATNALGDAVSTTHIKVEETNASNHATVEVKEAPKFLSQISSKISVSEGQSAHFEAKLSPAEDPDLKVEWYKDGKPLSMGHRFRTFHDFGIVILDILYTYEEDQGVYECRATNKFGSDVTKGTIECSSKSNLILTPQVPGEMKQSTLDHIHHLESMKLRTKTSVSGTHNVAPRFTLPIHNIEDLREAESAHFEARLIPTDDPNLTVEWFWNGKALKAGSRIRTFCDFGFVILEISPVYPEDSGEYMCKAKNAMGEAVTSATLKCSGKRNLIMDSQLPKGMEGAIDKIAYLEGLGKSRQITDTNDDLGNPPEFIVNLQDLLLAENSLAHFETRMTPINDPSMRVEWYHNGKQLSAGSRIKTINDFGFVILEVANVMTRDSGNYTCKATNKHGEASVSCNVTVKSKQSIITDPQLPRSFRSGTESIQRLEENLWKRGEERIPEEAVGHPPKFVTQIRDVTLIEGQAAHFDCRVEPVGDGSMKIEWFHESNPLCIGSRIHTLSDFGFIVLDIDWTFKRDSGTYICRATNKYGMSESRATLSVKSKKDINLDTQLPPGMSLDRLKELEKGKIESRLEEEEKISAPKFITQLESRAVGEGEPAHFNCRVEPKNDPKLVIKWYFNDKELSSGHRFRITHEFGYVALDILYTYPEDEGEYVCKAKNDLGEDITKCTLKCKELPAIQLEHQIPKGMKKSDYLVQMEASMKKYSQEMQLTEDDVYDAEKRQPPRFVTLIQSITDLVEMQAAKFECQLAPVGDPNMKVEWFFNGKPLPFKNRFTPIYDFGYVAMNFGWVYPEDSGEYVCKATNLYGMDETRAIIKTSGKPGIIFESQLPKGMASIERIREMESGWQRAPELIESETEKFKPCFVTTPEPQEVQEGDWARFCCRVTGYPKPRVMWLLNGHTVINGSKHKLVYDGMWHFDIPKCRDIDAGKVEVIARNQCGEAYAVTSLTVKPRADDFRSVLKHNVKRDYMNSKEYRKPEWVTRMEEIQKRLSEQQQSAKFTQEIKEVRLKEGMKAKFEAHFAGNPKPEITWYYNNEPLKNSKNVQIKVKEIKTILTLIECSADMAGYYTCKIRNPLGSDSTRAGLTVNKSTGGVEMPSQKTIEKLVKSEEDKIVLKQKKKEEKKQKLEEVKAKAQKEIKTEKVIVPPRAPIVKKPKQVPEKTEEKINFSRVQLKKAVPIDKPSTAKPEPVQLKPTPPKASKPVEPPAEKVELKPVPKKIKEEVKVSPKIQIKLQHTTITPKRTSDTKDTQKTTEKINSNTTKITERVIKSESIQEVQIQKPQKFPTKRSTIIEIKGEELRKGQTYKPKVDDEHENKMLKDDDDIDYKPDEQKTIKSKKMKDMGSNLLEEQKQAEEDNISEPSILHEKELQEKCNKNKEIKVLKKKVIKKKVLKDEETSKKSTKIKNLKTADHAKPRVTESEDQIVSERPRESKTKKEDSSELSIKENIQAVDSQNVKDILTQTSLDNVTESKDINKEKHLSADTTSIKELVLKEPTEQRSEEISKPSECFGPEMKDKIEIVMKKSSSIDNQITELLDSTPLSQSTQELKEVVLTRLKELANKDQELSKLLPPQLESNQLKEIVLKQPKEIGDNSKEEFHRIKFSDRDMEELKEIVIKKSKEIENKTTSLANKERLKLEIEQAKEVVLKKIKQIQDEGVKLSKLKMPELTAEELKEIVMKKAKQIKEDVSDLKRSEQLKLETDDIREVVMKSSVDLGETITELPAYKSPELDTEEIKEISMKECKDELTKRKKLSTNRADRKKEVLPVKVKRLENDEVLELDSSSIQLKSEDLKEIVIKKPKQPEEDVVILQDNNKPYTSKIEEIKEVALKKAEEPINKSTVLSSIESPKPVTEELQEMVAKTTKQLDTKSVQLPSLKPFQSTSEEIVEVVAKKMDKKAVDLSGSKNTHFSSNEVKEIPVVKPGESEKEIAKLSGSMTPEIAIKEIAMKKTRQIQNDTVDVLNAKLDEQEPKEMQEVVIKTPRQHEDSFTELSDSKAVTPETINLKEVIPEKKEKIRKDTPDKSSIKYNDDLDKVSEQSPLSLDSSAMKLDVTKKKIINKKSEQLVMEPMDIEKVLNQDELETKEMLEILIKKIKKGDSDSAKMIASVSKDINVKELEEIILRAIEDSHVEPTILSELKKNISSIDLKEIIYKKSNEISGTEADVQRVKKRILTEEELTEIPVEKREEGKLENQFKKSHLSSEESKRDVEKVSLTKEEVESTGKVHDEDMHILQTEEETLQISSKTSEESKTKKVVKKKGIKKIKTKKTPEGDQPQKTKSVDGNLDLPRKDDKGELVSDTSEGYDSSIFQLDDEIKRNVIDTVRKNSVKRNEELDSLSAEDRQAALKKDNLIKVEEKDVIMKKEKPMKKKKKKLSSKILENSESSRVDSTDEFTPDNTDTTKKELKAPTQAIMSDENLYTFDIKDETSTIKTTKIISASQEKLTEKEPTTKTEASKIDDIIQTDTVTNYIEPIKKSIKKQEKTTTDKTDKKIKETKQEDQKILEEKNETKEISEVPKSEDEKVKTTLKTKKKILKKVTQKDEAYLEESVPEKDEFTVEGKEIVLKSEQTSISEHVDEVSSLNEDVKPTEKSDSKPKKVVQLEKVADVKKLEEEKEQIKSAPSKKPEPSDKKLEVKDDRAVKKDDELRDKEKHEKSEPILDTSTPLQDNSTPMIEKSELEVTMLTEKSHPSSVNSIPILTEPTLAVEEPKLIIEEPKPIIEEPDSGSPKSKPKIFERKGEKSAPIVDEPKLVIKELQQDINVNEPTFDEPEPIIEEPTSKRKISRIAEEVKPSSEEAADAKITNINLKSEVEDTKVTKAEPDPITKQTQEEERQLPEPKKKSKDERPKLPQIEDDLLSSKKNESVSKTIKEVKKTKKIVKKKTEIKNEVEGEKQISEEKIRSEKVTTESLIDNQSTDVDITKKESSKIIKKSVEETRVVEEKTKSIVEDIKKIENGNEMVSSNITSEIQALEPNAVVTKDGESVEEITKVPESLQNKDTSKQKKQVRFIENDDHEIEPQIKIIEDDKVVRKVKKVKKMKKKEKKSHDDDNEDVETLIQDEVQAIVMKLVKRVIEKRPDSQSIFNEECVTDIPNADTLPVQVALLSICEKELLQPKVVSDVITQEVKNETMSSKNIGLKALFKIVQNDSAFYETLSSICVEPEYFNSDAIHTQLTKLRFQEALARGIQNVNEEIALLDAVTQEVSKQAVYQLFQKIQQGLTVSELDSSDTLLKIPGIDSEPAQMALMSICETYLQPNEILTTIPWEDRRGKENFLYNALGLKALKKTLEHCSVETLIQDFFVHPEYFSSDHILKQKAKLGGQEITCSDSKELSETVSIRSKKISSFNKAKAIVTRDLKEGNVVEESVDEMCLQSRIKSDRSSLPTQMALISICQNVLTPSAVEQIVSDESRSIDKGFEHVVGSRVLVKTLERVPIVESFSDYCVQPEYFTLETFKKQVAKYNIQESEILSVQIIPQEEASSYAPKKFLTSVASIVRDIKEGKSLEDIRAAFEMGTLFELESIESQMGLLSLAERLLTPSTVQEIVSEELESSGVKALSSIGLKPFVQGVEQTPLDVCSVLSGTKAEFFEKSAIKEKFAQLQSLAKEFSVQTSEEKVSIHDRVQEPAINAILNLNKLVKKERTVSEAISSISAEIFSDISSPEKQYGLLKTAHRISDAPLIQEMLLNEKTRSLITNESQENLGIKILAQTLEINPFGVEDIAPFCKALDFESFDKLETQSSLLLDFAELMNVTKAKEEVGILHEMQIEKALAKKAILSMSNGVKEGIPVSEMMVLYNSGEFPELFSPQSQCCMLTNAQKINSAACYKEVICCSTKDSKELREFETVGFRALMSALEESTISIEDSALCFDSLDYSEKKAKVQIAQILKEAAIIHVPKLKEESDSLLPLSSLATPSEISALFSYVEDIKYGKSVQEVFESYNPQNFPTLSTIESQMALLSTVERFKNVPVIKETVSQELVSSGGLSLKTVGTRALLDVVDETPADVNEILSYVSTQDMTPDNVKAKMARLLCVAGEANISQETSNVASEEYHGPMKAIADIALRLEHGASVEEVNAAFEAHEFPELESLGSQMAMIRVVERVGHSALINQVLLEEKGSELVAMPESKGRKISSQIGFRALMSTLSHEPYKTEEVITSFNPKDFVKEEVAMADYAKLVHDSKELKIAQTSEISTEIKESIDTEIKKASSSEVKSEMVTVEANKSATKISASQSVETAQVTSTSSDIGRPIIKEGDTFFALATFVSDTGEAMNLVEGEKVHVLEWNNNDWWYVKKHITEESGWVPAQYLKDEKTYTLYVQKKLVEKIEKLPVFEQPKEGEKTFSPKIITKVQSMNAVDGCQVEFSCQVEGNPRPQITWFRQTAIIKPSQDFQISYADDNVATLVIKEVFPEDAGTFTCVAKNCVGYASSSSDLTVERPLSDHGSFEKHDRRSLSRESSLADIVEGIPPTFAQRPQTKNAEEGTIAELECRFVAIPEAEVKWFHNKVELKNTNRLTIHHQADMHMYCSIVKILDVRSEDAGTYEVSAKNREGEASNTLVLNVTTKTISQEPPMIVKPLTPTVCKLNDSIKMEAVITGKPKPKLSWYHNGSELLQDETNVKITEKENIYALTISQVSQSHDGDYLIKASNEYGFAQTQANLCVQGQEITFIKPLEDVEIKERSSYEMFVEVSDEKANVKWQKDGQEIKSDDQQYKFKREGGKHYLIIHCATVHHEGEYVASVGEQECSCELTIIELPPEFTKSLTPCTLTSGETGMFEIELSKGDAVTRWFKHGLEIEFSQRVQLIIDGKKQKLQIYKADKRDAGEYSVTVGYKSCTAMLFVEEPKVSFVANLNKVTTGVLGQSVRLTVKLSKKDVNILWLKDGKQITDGPNYSFETDGCEQTIIISGATIQDVGQYTCVAENVKTTTELELAGEDVKLIILESDINREVTVNRGQDIILNVPYQETSQKPQIKWVFQGIELYSSEKTQIKTTRKEASLTIKHIQSIDCGMYTVKLWNSVSEVSVDFVLNIKDKPSPPRGPASVDWKSDDSMELLWNGPLSDGGSAVLEYIVERKEEGKKSWKQVGTSIHTRMEIRGLGKNISYNFRIIARNSVGNSDPFIVEEIVTATSSSSSTKKSLPGCPNVQVTDVTSKSVTLQWSPPVNNGGAELIEYVIEKKISTSHSWEKAATVDPSVTLYTIENLKEKCQYYFRVSAVNEVGAGEPTSTEIVSLRTHARPPSSPTAPLEINSIGPTAIMVEWGAPESDGGAPLEGYKVAVRDAKRHMWMEVGRVSAETQKLKVQDLAEGHEYFIRIFAKNEVGFSDPLENDEPLKVIRPADFKEEETIEKDKHEETPSLSFSTTETLSSWMREANMDADIQSYTTSSSLRRDEYFFRIWYYAKKLFK